MKHIDIKNYFCSKVAAMVVLYLVPPGLLFVPQVPLVTVRLNHILSKTGHCAHSITRSPFQVQLRIWVSVSIIEIGLAWRYIRVLAGLLWSLEAINLLLLLTLNLLFLPLYYLGLTIMLVDELLLMLQGLLLSQLLMLLV